MIYTLTLNPALDHSVRLDSFLLGETNRVAEESIQAGGKGVNVSKILKNLGEDSLALGFIGGFTGSRLEEMLKKEGLNTDFLRVAGGNTRINTKIKEKKESELNGPGPKLTEKDASDLLKKFDRIKKGDLVFLSGSLPASLPVDFYGNICKRLKNSGAYFAVDTSGEPLKPCLKYNPFLVKPNLRELEELFDVKIENKEKIATYAQKLRDLGARNVIVSLGPDGAYLASDEGDKIFLPAFKGNVINSVGAGDSMVAAFCYGKLIKNLSYKKAFKLAMAAGAATAFSKSLASKDEILKLYGGSYEN